MKSVISLIVLSFSFTASAFSFVTADDVRAALKADAVIEVDVNAIAPLIVDNAACSARAESKSANAYVVDTAYETALYVTSENVDDLEKCVVLYVK